MSLINEALKKAQSERPSSVHNHPAMQGMPMEPQQKPPKKKRYLFGFIMSVLVFALLSTMVTTYLVFQILGEDKGSDSNGTQVAEVSTVQELETTPAQPVVPQKEEVVPEAIAEEPVPVLAETEVQEESVPAPLTTPEAKPVPVSEPPVVSAPAPPPVVEKPAPQVALLGSDPLVWNRLEELEIRGIMSGGAKVLIFDSRTNKARAYKPGDLVDGALSLKVSSISNAAINFVNDDGSIFPKPF
jgi:hypothetical protein